MNRREFMSSIAGTLVALTMAPVTLVEVATQTVKEHPMQFASMVLSIDSELSEWLLALQKRRDQDQLEKAKHLRQLLLERSALAVGPLIRRLNEVQDPIVASAIQSLLAEMAPEVFQPLIAAARSADTPREARLDLCGLLLNLAEPYQGEAVDALVEVLANRAEDSYVREAIAQLAADLPASPSLCRALTAVLEDEDETVRTAAQSALTERKMGGAKRRTVRGQSQSDGRSGCSSY